MSSQPNRLQRRNKIIPKNAFNPFSPDQVATYNKLNIQVFTKNQISGAQSYIDSNLSYNTFDKISNQNNKTN